MASIHNNNTTSTFVCLVFYHSQVLYVLALVGKIKRTFLDFIFSGHTGFGIQLAHRRAEKHEGWFLSRLPQKKTQSMPFAEHVSRQTPGYCSLSDRWRVTKYGTIPKSRIYISADVYTNKCDDVLHLLIT